MGVKRKDPYYDEYYSLEVIQPQRAAIPHHAYHDHFEEQGRGSMTIEVKAISKLFVGTGEYEVDAQGIYQPFARIGARLAIPGTSIKGTVRAYAEALSSSCDLSSSPEGEACRADRGSVCICCRIFGALGFQGSITFSDTATLEPTVVDLTKYTMSVRRSDPQGRYREGRRFYYHNKPGSPRLTNRRTGRLFPDERVEVIPEGTKFISELLFENLSKEEIGLLLLAMGLSPAHRFNLKLGGGKNRQLGSVCFDLPSGIKLIEGNAYASFSLTYNTKQLHDWGKEAVEAYKNSLSEDQHRTVLESIQAFQSDPC